MRKVSSIVLACMLLSVIAIAAHAAEWVEYYAQETPRFTKRSYYDEKSITRTREGHIRVLGMASTNVGSSTTLYEIDCKGSRMQSLNARTYEKPMARGKVAYKSDTALPLRPLSEAADLDPHKAVLFKVVCEAKLNPSSE